MTGHHQRSSTSVVQDQFSQWSNTFSRRAACRLQHCSTQLRNLIATSVSTGAVSGARGLLLLLL